MRRRKTHVITQRHCLSRLNLKGGVALRPRNCSVRGCSVQSHRALDLGVQLLLSSLCAGQGEVLSQERSSDRVPSFGLIHYEEIEPNVELVGRALEY
jgi:hypothetical protein